MAFLEKADTFIQRILFEIVEALRVFCTLLFGFLFLAVIPFCCFDYEFDLTDIDLFEVVSIALISLLIWRFFKRGALANKMWTRTFYRMMQIMIGVFLVWLTLVAAMGGYLAVLENGHVDNSEIYNYYNALQALYFLISASVIYIYAPLPAEDVLRKPETISAEQKAKDAEDYLATVNAKTGIVK